METSHADVPKQVAKPESQQMRTAKLFTCIIGANVIFYLWRK